MLSRRYRLRRRNDFAHVYKRGKAEHTAAFTVKYLKNDQPNSRAAVVVSSKISKKAVIRNRTRRRFYAQIRQIWPELAPGYDLVVLVRHQALDLRGQDLNRMLRSCFKRAGVLN